MAGGRFDSAEIQGWLAASAAKPCWAALMTDDPYMVSDPLTAEVLGSAYRRPSCPLELVDTVLRNQLALSWSGLPPMSRIAGVAGFDAPFNGSLRWWCPLPTPLDFPAGGGWAVGARTIYLGVDS